MSVKIITPQFLQHIVRESAVTVHATTIGGCLEDFSEKFPSTRKLLFDENDKLHGYLDIYLNGKSTYPEELSKAVNEDDELYILLVMTGG